MTTWLLVCDQLYSENTPEYGHGDYPERLYYLGAVVEADTKRKAQNAVKKLYPQTRFGGMFSPELVTLEDQFWPKRLIGPYDKRLTEKAKHRHCQAISSLYPNTSKYLKILGGQT